MKPTGLIDLHCDTLTNFMNLSGSAEEFKRRLSDPQCRGALLEEIAQSDTLDTPGSVLSLSKMRPGVKWAQTFAIFIPDEVRGAPALEFFRANCVNFNRQMRQFSDRVVPCRTGAEMDAAFTEGKFAAILAVEGGAALAGDLANVRYLAECGVRVLTLVWNGANELGSGHSNPEMGLTDFGKAVIPELEKCGILIDVSHLNDAGFEDVCAIAKKPFIATHSNARAICGHKRNLTDAQIAQLIRRDGLIGLNFFLAFLREDRNVQSLDDLYRHTIHFLEQGAGPILALGSDYDGAALPECLNSVERSLTIYDYFLSRGMKESLADDIMFGNAHRFLLKNLR